MRTISIRMLMARYGTYMMVTQCKREPIQLCGSALAFQRSGAGVEEKHAPQVCHAVRGEMRIPRQVGTALTYGRRRVGLRNS